jgi:magnesium-transporting ATPase (P-type)
MDLISQILLAIIEVTIYAILFIGYAVLSLFSPKYREKLKQSWQKSLWGRIGIIFGVTLCATIAVAICLFWMGAFSSEKTKTEEAADYLRMLSETFKKR